MMQLVSNRKRNSYRLHIEVIFFLLSGPDETKESPDISPPPFQPGFNSSFRLPTGYQSAESFAYAQYAHDTYLMASNNARPSPYTRNMDYGASYRHRPLKAQYQNPSPGFGYNFDAR